MSNQIFSRRSVLQGALAAAVTSFNPVSRSWATRAQPGSVSLPPLDGQVLLDEATCVKAAEDFGHGIHRRPSAVLVPGSAEDIAKMVRFARAQGLKVAASRGIGQSHSAYGQAQAEAGVVIDMSALSTLHEIGKTSAWVDAGVQWLELLKATVPLGKSPPSLTDYIDLSIGGTLSVGGIGGQVFRWGMQTDNVLELDVVTGKGELVRCSPWHGRSLFDAVRAGLGQFGIIVRARLRLVDVPPSVRSYSALYTELAPFMRDQLRLIEDGRFDCVEGFAVPSPSGGGRAYQLEVSKYFSPGDEPSDARLLAGLSFQPGTLRVRDSGYFDFVNRLEPIMESDRRDGTWRFPHPWLDMFVPERAAVPFVEQVLAQTPEAEMGRGRILIFAFHPKTITAPFARMPTSERAFIFSLLRNADPPTPENTAALLARNQSIFKQLTAVGGKRYGASAVPMSADDWRGHFHPLWERFEQAKRRFDPDNILAPGQGIF